jgi:two-component system chemotaxis sensor kinase CheA
MDVVRATIESLGGTVEFSTVRGGGSTTTLIVPITAAVQRVLLLQLGEETVAIPIARVERIIEVNEQLIETNGREAFALIDDEPVPVLALAECIAFPPRPSGAVVTLVLTDVRGERMALRVDKVVGQQQIYVKPVPELLTPVRALAGLTILGDGRPVFVLDQNQLS